MKAISLLFVPLLLSLKVFAGGTEPQKHAYNATWNLKVLELVSAKCGRNNYEIPQLWKNLGLQVELNLLVSMEKFLEIIRKDTELFEQAEDFSRRYLCIEEDVDFDLDEMYSNYDNASFNLDMATPLAAPLVTRSEAEANPPTTREDQLKELIDSSKSVAVGTVLDYIKTPKTYRAIFGEKHEFVFKTEFGWKKDIEPYFPVKDASDSYRDYLIEPIFENEQEKNDYRAEIANRSIRNNLGKRILIFTSERGFSIQAWIPMESSDGALLLKLLRGKNWEYVGYNLKQL